MREILWARIITEDCNYTRSKKNYNVVKLCSFVIVNFDLLNKRKYKETAI